MSPHTPQPQPVLNGLLHRYPALSRAIEAGTARYGYPLYWAILAALGASWEARRG